MTNGSSEIRPTAEQERCLDLFATGDPLIIEAGAGTGKTSTLRLLGSSTPRSGTYVAFNKAIVEEARVKMPVSVLCTTAHSLAFRAVGQRYAHRLRGERMRSYDVAKQLGLGGRPLVVRYGTQTKALQPGYLASLVMRAMTRFCQTADPAPTVEHLPYIDGIDPPDADGKRTWANNRQVREYLRGAVARAWADLAREDGTLRFTHDVYLKLWQLGDPKIGGEFILFDEGQDASPVMLDAVGRQDAQLVIVGDSQQQIYEWRGAVNALASLDAERAFLTQSFRFGPAIADIANEVLDLLGAELRLTGTPTIDSSVGPVNRPNVVLARSNAVAVETVLQFQKAGLDTHLVGGGEEILAFARAASRLMDREKVFHPELACFDSWGEVQDYVANDPQGDELALLVRLVDDYGVDVIVAALDQVCAEAQADVIVSTAHKAKGREWNRVRLAPDFPEEPDPNLAGELRLLYVAATRARDRLDVTMCGALHGLVKEAQP